MEYLLPAPPKSKGSKAIVLRGERMGELVAVLRYKRTEKRLIAELDGNSESWEDDEDKFCWVQDPMPGHAVISTPRNRGAHTIGWPAVPTAPTSIQPLPVLPLALCQPLSLPTLPANPYPTSAAGSAIMDQQALPGPSHFNNNEEGANKNDGVGNALCVPVDQRGEREMAIVKQKMTVHVGGTPPQNEWWQTWEEEEERRSFSYDK